MKNPTQHFEALWRRKDYPALADFLRQQRAAGADPDTDLWFSMLCHATGDPNAAYRYLASRVVSHGKDVHMMAMLGQCGDTLNRPLLSLHGWQAAVNARPLELFYRKKLSRYHIGQGNPRMAMSVLESYRLFHHQDQEAAVDLTQTLVETDVAAETPDIPRESIVVLVPIYDDPEVTRSCVGRVLKFREQNKRPTHVLLINDQSPNVALSEWLRNQLHESRPWLELLENRENQGFIRTVNRGLRRYPNNDVILLNADAFVHGNWVDRLFDAAYSEYDIGTVTPFTNFGELLSFPKPDHENPLYDEGQVDELDTIAAQVNDCTPQGIPVGVGFCMYLRRDALNAVGVLNEKDYKRGYGEEFDLCLRMDEQGFRSVCATNVYVGHLGGRSFGAEKALRAAQNIAVIKQKYPEYSARYDGFVQQDKLAPARQQLEEGWLQVSRDWHLVIASDLGPDDPNIRPLRIASAAQGEPLLFLYRDRGRSGRVFRLWADSVPSVRSLHFRLPEEKRELHALFHKLHVAHVTSTVALPVELAELFPDSAHVELPAVSPAVDPQSRRDPSAAYTVVAVVKGPDPIGEYDVIHRTALTIVQQQLPIRLWLQYSTLNDSALIRLGCVDVGPCPTLFNEAEHLRAGGASIAWQPQSNMSLESLQSLVHGW